MKKIRVFFIAAALAVWVMTAYAAEKAGSVDLREYQQPVGTINVLAAPFGEDDSYLAVFNFGQTRSGDNVNFYQGTCIIDQKDNETLHPLLVKKIRGDKERFSEIILNKKGDAPYKQGFRTVQTNSAEKINYMGSDSTHVVFLGNFKVATSAGSFDDCIGVKIYNEETGEGMVQYMAKGYGTVYIEGIKADGTKVEIARLMQSRGFDDADIEWFRQNYFV